MDHDLKLVSSVPVQPFKPSWIPLASHPGRAVTLFLGQKNGYLCTPSATGTTGSSSLLALSTGRGTSRDRK